MWSDLELKAAASVLAVQATGTIQVDRTGPGGLAAAIETDGFGGAVLIAFAPDRIDASPLALVADLIGVTQQIGVAGSQGRF